jgi:hypothetical protein
MVKLICMTFNGEHVTERGPIDGLFESVKNAAERSEDMGSRWFFYPFHFILSASGKTVKAAPAPLEVLNGKRLSTVKALFERLAARKEAQNMGPDDFCYFVLTDGHAD